MITCPVCDAEVDIDEDELEEGETLTCDECGAELRVVGVDPVEVEPVEEEEDEDDEDSLDLDEEDEEDEDEESWR